MEEPCKTVRLGASSSSSRDTATATPAELSPGSEEMERHCELVCPRPHQL